MRPSKDDFGFRERLRRAGAEVVTLGEAATSDLPASQQVQLAALAANEDLLHRRVLRLPLGLFKYAMTLDGKIAATGGHSLWVSGSVSRTRVMRERAGSDAVIVGGGTVRRDNPRLTARVERGSAHQPARIAYLRDKGVQILELEAPFQPLALAQVLYERGFQRCFWECGGTLAAPAIDQGVLHKVLAFVAPKLAKFGEGDERWLVKDLGQDGRNVNNWHWVERDALGWSKERLTELLVGQELTSGTELRSKVKKLKSLGGEAIVNNRKGKTIVAYELDLALTWSGTLGEGTKVKGEILVPYISEENHDEDPEVTVTVSAEAGADAKAAEVARGLVVDHGRPVVHRALATFVRELRAGAPAAAEAKPAAPQKRDRRRIELRESFYASASDIYDCFTNGVRMQAYTQSPAQVDAREGGAFSLFGGSVQGSFRELRPGSRIVMDWRFSNWADGDSSLVTIEISEPEKGNTHLHLVQTGIPEADRFGHHDVVGLAQAGWANQIFHRIRQVFGYGI
ncbi:hypothetical protein QBZ16_002894 [Prototheca wickerhamii]|uniref:Activator of Hsp90 ATPase AHSA1-like N-terminal domain-containing protein n=1 Tax=Prototheca wickerhamii TaxID=3111 RepID=A0AAD9MM68_PROWI|nr:hypothetical protein QBZ16_002894 [Prototheca wickerhamii]